MPETQKVMFTAYKEAGFDCVRIPVSWLNAMDIANGDYTIDSRYINRVATIVNWALEADLFVILNDHHDYEWCALFGPEETREEAYRVFDAGWASVANSWGTAQEVKEQNEDFAQMQRFTNEGYGVIVGEYAVAMLKQSDGTYVRKNDDIKWMTNVLDNCDKYNYCPLIWESQDVKCELGFVDSDVADLFKSRSYAVEKAEGN